MAAACAIGVLGRHLADLDTSPDLGACLRAVSQASAELLDVAVGFAVADLSGQLRVAAWTSAAVHDLMHLELQGHAGPGVDSWSSGRPIVNVSLTEARRRWPLVVTEMTDAGFRSVHALPVRPVAGAVGAIELYCTRRRPLSRTELTLCQALMTVAGAGVQQARAVHDPDVRSGLVGGRYRIDELIGSGGTADVYRARDMHGTRTVAVKLPQPARARNPGVVARSRREAQSAARLDHPNIVSVLDTGQDEVSDSRGGVTNRPYLVLEHIDGSTLREVLADRHAFRPDEAVRIIAEVLAALQHSHERGVVHGDITAANVMVSIIGAVMVLDFDNSTVLPDAAATHTLTIRGTPAYSAPEHARGMAVDTRADLYSTGCLLYELLTGSPPFTGESATALAHQHVHAHPHPPSVFCPDITPEMDAVVLRALAKERTERFQTAEQFRRELLAACPRHDRRKVGQRDG